MKIHAPAGAKGRLIAIQVDRSMRLSAPSSYSVQPVVRPVIW